MCSFHVDTKPLDHSLFPLRPGERSRCNVLSDSVDPDRDLACFVEGNENYQDHIGVDTEYLPKISLQAVTPDLKNDQSLMALSLSDSLLGYLKESGGDKLWNMVTMKFCHFPVLVT